MAADSGDPLHAVSLAPSLLLQTLAGAAGSPSKAHEMLFQGISQSMAHKGSKELVEQARLTVKSHGNIQNIYPDDGDKAAATNGKNNRQGRRPALGRKRPQFSLKSTSSNSVQNVDFSAIENIEDPDEYFLALERLENAEKELKRLRGEVPTELAENHQTINARRSRPGILGRKSHYNYQLPVNADISNAFEGSASQRATPKKTQAAEEAAYALHPEKVKQTGAPKSSQCELLDDSKREDSVAEKDSFVNLDELLSSFKDLEEREEEDLLRKSLQLKQINIGKVCLPELNIPGDNLRPISSIAVRNNPLSGHIPESPERTISRSPLATISNLKRRISLGDALKDHYTDCPEDDESENSPEIGQNKQSPMLTSHDGVGLMTTGEASGAMVVGEERPSPSDQSPEHVLEPEQNIVNSVTTGKRKTRNSPSRAYRNSEVIKEKHASTVEKCSLEEGGDVALDSPITEKSNQQIEDPSSHILKPSSTEVLASPLGRNVVTDSSCSAADTGTILHATVDSSQHKAAVASQTVAEGEGTSQDKSTHLSEVPPADVHAENLPYMQDGNIEEQTVQIRNAASPSRGKKPKAAQRKSKKQESNRRKSLADGGLVWQSGVRRSTRVRSRPLQHWLGERFLYGRIHNTMTTVIGIKSFSPGQDGKKPAMRVKSFVPDQYADLVAQVAKY